MSQRNAKIFGVDGKPIGELPVPTVFSAVLRKDMITKAVVAQESHRFQPQGRNAMAGKRTTAESFGVGRGISRVPRIGGHGPLSGTAAFAPGTVGGRLAFAPVTLKKIAKSINRKERRSALDSAIAATGSKDLVRLRGHRVDEDIELPLIVTDEVEKLAKSSTAKTFLTAIGIWDDIDRVKKSKKIRGKGRKHSVGPLIIVSEYQGAQKAFQNFEGVEVIRVKDLNVSALAPGTHPGRLAVWTESAIKALSERSWLR
ncbi:MAG TPA: 50S ribosomal protein L4 [Candidatus Bathyarchaeia archaeon]|jgi:large subunit ribosomal protein L4e|nr:50S ribosomal protein L4 [Candidatus Bathyarchaeia archaeon]